MSETGELLFEIGCEELPSSFVEAALEALPTLTRSMLGELRLGHGAVEALGTPRRLALRVEQLELRQRDLEERVTGPPVKAAFKDGAPTRAAEAFAKKLGCSIDALERVETEKGEYLAGTRRETGRRATDLLPEALAQLVKAIPFRKSMRWGSGSLSFGRPIRWLAALLGAELLPVAIEGIDAGKVSYGHRFLHPTAFELDGSSRYVEQLRAARVVVDPDERRALMRERLHAAAKQAGGELIEDEFLMGENLSLVEEPQVIVGGFDESFLALPEEVILEVARGHQRYFGVRDAAGKLMPKYLAVVNTAEKPDTIAQGNDRVMRARLADARFFHQEDLKKKLVDRRAELGGIVFQKRLGSVLDKVARIERLVPKLGQLLGSEAETVEVARRGAALCKCDLVTWMVGEFPELQGEVGRAYALEQGESDAVADVIRAHYQPKGAADATAPTDAAALVALADRLDTLVGCFAIGLSPTGAADPFALRRACLGVLRTLLDRDLDLDLQQSFVASYAGYADVELELDENALCDKLLGFFRDRLRGVLIERIEGESGGLRAGGVADAVLAVAAGRPIDARARMKAIVGLDHELRATVGEVFKRASNIAKDAPVGEPTAPSELGGDVHASESALFDAYSNHAAGLARLIGEGAYGQAFDELGRFAPLMASYFDDVFVMADDAAVRDNRLRLMRAISETCSRLAQLELIGG